MQIQSILLALVGYASAEGCCTIYSETNMEGNSHELCYDNSNAYAHTTTYVLSEIYIDWKVASISCEADDHIMTGYSPCLASDHLDTCGEKSWFVDGFGWMSYGDNNDLTGVDMPVIGIYV